MENHSQSSPNIGSWIVLIFLSFIWGSSFILIKKSLIAFDPIEVGALRVFITFLGFFPVVLYHWNKINWSDWKKFLAVGIMGSALPSVLFAIAQTQVSSSIAGVLNSITPVFTLIIGVLLFQQKTKQNQIIGVGFGFIGAILLLLGDKSNDTSSNISYGMMIVLATICYAYNVNSIKAWFKDTSPIIISAVSFSLLGPICAIYLFSTTFIEHLTTHEYGWHSLAAVIFLALIGTGLATILFFKLIQDTDAIFGSSVAFVIPIFAVLWGLFDGESFYLIQVLGMVLVLIGIYLIREKKKK